MRYLELRRHTDNDGDALTDEGIRAAEEVGARLQPPYAFFAATSARRAIQTAEILRHAVKQDDLPIVIADGLRSTVEDRWREAARTAGKGADLEGIRRVDPDLVELETRLLGRALGELFDGVPVGGRGLFVGHTPTTEAAVLGLTGELIAPLGKGAGVLLTDADGRLRATPVG